MQNWMRSTDEIRVTGELPEGQHGRYAIKRFTVSQEDERLQRLRCLFNRETRFVPAGEYTVLSRIGDMSGTILSTGQDTPYAGTIVMSDTPDELRDILPLYRNASGHVLINGLGLGCTVKMCMLKPEVTHVTVVELEKDIIELVGSFWKQRYGDLLTVVHADAYEYKPPKGSYFGAVWHDIWDEICGDNLPGMHKLHRKYGRFAAWQGSWARSLCERR